MSQLGISIPKSNFNLIGTMYKDIIIEIRRGSNENLPGYNTDVISIVSKVIVFDDMSKLYCKEFVNADQELEAYWYDWSDSNGRMIMKFHAHFHPDETDPAIRKFDPFHLHKRAFATDDNCTKREVDTEYRELANVLIFIKDFKYARQHYT